MADILIRGMEMPKTCCQCDLKFYDPEKRWDENGIEQIGAWVCKRTREIIWNTQRGENCPLLPLPEGHGKIIDADAIWSNMTDDQAWAFQRGLASDIELFEILEAAEAIVPAEGGTDNG